jgi:hypothetical protein
MLVVVDDVPHRMRISMVLLRLFDLNVPLKNIDRSVVTVAVPVPNTELSVFVEFTTLEPDIEIKADDTK